MTTVTAVYARPTVPGEIRYYPMAASQTFKKGEFLYLDNNGRLTVCAASPAGIAGIAMSDAQACAQDANGAPNPIPSGTTYTTTNVACPITIAKRGQQFTLNVTSGGTATTTSRSIVGHHYNLYVASNVHYCDLNSTTQVFVIDALAPDDVLGDTTGRVIVEVCKGYAQLDMTTS
jgi:hypothetical protein